MSMISNHRQKLSVTRLVFPGPYTTAYESEELDANPADDRIVVETHYSLISAGTELALYTGTHVDLPNPRNKYAKFPFYPGYAVVGRVLAAGAGTDFQPGDPVFAVGHHASHGVYRGHDEEIVKLPEGLDPQLAVFARMAEISMTAILQSRLKRGDLVVVLGAGLVGNLAAQLYAAHGAVPIVVDLVQARLDVAAQTNLPLGVLAGEGVDLQAEIRRLSGGRDPDIVVEASGVPALVNTALELCRRHGQVILLGSTRGLVTLNVYSLIHQKGISLTGAHGSMKGIDGLPSSGELYREMLGMLAAGALLAAPFITHVLPYDQAEQAYDWLLKGSEGAFGVLLDWQSHGERG